MKATILLMLLSLPVSGCAPGYRMIKEADLLGIDAQMQEQIRHLECISRKQESLQDTQHTQQIMMADYDEVRVQLQEIALMQDEQARRQCELVEAVRKLRLEQQKVVTVERREPRQEPSVPAAEDKQIIGAVEKVFLSPPGTIMRARIDTGAVTSSLDARDIELFERNGDRWVRFTIVNPEDQSEIFLELELVRKVRIIQAEQEEPEKRPVVELGVTVGRHTQTAQFTLTDRRHMEFPMLIGRNILKDIMLVGVSKVNIAPPLLADDSGEGGETP